MFKLRRLFVLSTITSVLLGQGTPGIQIPSGTKVSCRLEQTISSATAEEGQQVQLSTTEDVKVGDVIVIPQNSTVIGTIVTAQEKRRMGRTGKLDFSIDKVRASDNEFIPLRYTLNKREGGSHAVSTGVMTAGAAVLFWPAAPFFLLRKGKDININKGIVLERLLIRTISLKTQVPEPFLELQLHLPRRACKLLCPLRQNLPEQTLRLTVSMLEVLQPRGLCPQVNTGSPSKVELRYGSEPLRFLTTGISRSMEIQGSTDWFTELLGTHNMNKGRVCQTTEAGNWMSGFGRSNIVDSVKRGA